MHDPGDLNLDGVVDAADLELLLSILSHPELLMQLSDEQRGLLDFDGTGHIRYRDIDHLLDYLLNTLARQEDPDLERLRQAVVAIRRKYTGKA